MARPGDLILVAGKGHEDYQIIGTKKTHFDDREVLSYALNRIGSI
jgi:UDP-N-acetylmuramoyl-L-alanyl-D-glutamate--2,6-diaminopimelate ligase